MAVPINEIRTRARKKAAEDGTTVEVAMQAIIDSYTKSGIQIDYSIPVLDETDLDFT